MDALVGPQVEAVVALGSLADSAWKAWKATPKGKKFAGAYARQVERDHRALVRAIGSGRLPASP